MRLAVITALCLMIALPAQAQSKQNLVTVDLAEDHVDITTGFTGAYLSLFGVKDGPGEVAIVVTGPKYDMTVRRKERVFGAWMNGSWMTFDDVPVYYNYATSVPERELATPEVLNKAGVGIESLQPETGSWAGQQKQEDFRAALIRNEQQAGLFSVERLPIYIISHNFFRANFYLPANVHTGIYKIQTLYFHDGLVRDYKTTHLRVEHVGLNARISEYARNSAFSYGLLCVSLAIFAGWFSNRIRRRT